ncbi:MAG: 5'/3'-nucleotidase SurE [Brevundimonas sp.]|jgi:5'-nucleotidase|nr:5'/3'-nucleotidase SurE [Brevundimonas sp.]
MRFSLHLLTGLAALAVTSPALARNIVLGNDDGLTANVKALYDALKAEGHDVIVAVPCQQQSGMGAAMKMLRPLGPLTADCLNGAAKAGDPGAGPMTRAGVGTDFHYVDGTPVMALLYGIDVVAQARWGRAPDLVLSGPNIGQNAGNIVISSGTVSNAQWAMIRGIPAIALSAGEKTNSGPDLVNPQSVQIAARSLELLRQLEGKAGKTGALLPPGVGLNVNFPDNIEAAKWRMARIGSFMRYDVRFVGDLAKAMGRSTPAGQPALPGMVIGLSSKTPGKAEAKDEAAVVQTDIAVSVMQVGYDAPTSSQQKAARLLKPLAGK